VGASAWISSTITLSTPTRVSRACEVSIRYSDSGVVIRMSGGWRTSVRRSEADVSPVRTPTVGSQNGSPSRCAASAIPRSGLRRFFSMSTASARSGDTYTTRTPAPSGAGEDPSRSIAHRKAASVLPDPVGAHSNVCSPRAIGSHAWACAGVGSAKEDSNHDRTGDVNLSRAVVPTAGLYRRGPTADPRNYDEGREDVRPLPGVPPGLRGVLRGHLGAARGRHRGHPGPDRGAHRGLAPGRVGDDPSPLTGGSGHDRGHHD